MTPNVTTMSRSRHLKGKAVPTDRGRGEIYHAHPDFEKLNATGGAPARRSSSIPRNAAAGAVRQLDASNTAAVRCASSPTPGARLDGRATRQRASSPRSRAGAAGQSDDARGDDADGLIAYHGRSRSRAPPATTSTASSTR